MNARVTRLIGVVLVAIAVPAYAQTPAATRSAQERGAGSFDSNGVQIHYADRGRGVPIVLLHGLTGSYARHWESTDVMAALETAGYRVIAMDCRGHGQSGKPRDSSQYGLEMVRDVVRLLDHLKIDRAHIVGYSMGGAIAAQLLVRYPSRLITVTLLGAGWEGEDVKVVTSQTLALAEGFANRDASVLIRGVMSPGQNRPTDDEVAALNASLFARNDPEVLAAVTRGLLPLFDISEDSLRTTTLPVLAIIGELDRNVTAVDRMGGVVRTLEVVRIPGASHATSVRPSAEHLVAFLGRHKRD